MNKRLIQIFSICFYMELLVCIEASSMIPLTTYLAEFFKIKPSFLQYVNLGYYMIGLTVPFVGILGDKKGNKKVINCALLMSAGGILISSLAKSGLMYGLGRTFSGFAYILMNSVLIAYISSFTSYENRGKATGVIKVAFGTGMILGPMLSTYFVGKYSLFNYYFALSILALIGFILSLTLPETDAQEAKDKFDIKAVGEVFRSKSANKILISFLLLLAALYLELNFLSIWLSEKFSLSIDKIGFVYTVDAFGTILGIIMCVSLSDRFGKHRFAYYSMVVMLVCLLTLQIPSFNVSITAVIVVTFLLMAGVDSAITSLQALSSEVFAKQRSFFMTLTGMNMSIAGLSVSIFGPFLYDWGGFMANLKVSCVLLIPAIIILYTVKKDKQLMQKLGE